MSDYNFMKSGFDNIQDAVDEEEMKKNVVAIIVKFSESALKTAAKYVDHCECRTIIMPEDIKRAMMLEMFLFKHRENLLEEVEAIKQELFQYDEEDEDLTYGYDADSDVDEEPEFSESQCTCSICRAMNNNHTTWENLEVTSPYEILLKQHIENMC